ncbi:hypothetical protein BLA29_010338 [Euroglyphus maynei]|uniref:Uncharacterized protein n=1 Tax=Euroglyphus maynei TaxID=6958 RepID=A0A1Y3BJL0_EURMA|nr:hypothetical protein BLA29_010338 [Euroglyphus maynei]
MERLVGSELKKEKEILMKAAVLDDDEIEEDDEVAAATTSRIPRDISNHSELSVKEISAPYTLPHYPIELEEQKKIAAHQLAQQIALKELEERATHDEESISNSEVQHAESIDSTSCSAGFTTSSILNQLDFQRVYISGENSFGIQKYINHCGELCV